MKATNDGRCLNLVSFRTNNRALHQRSDLLFYSSLVLVRGKPLRRADKHCQFGSIVYAFRVFDAASFWAHIHAFLLSTLVLCCTMVTTKHCCYGARRSNYRCADTDRMKNVFFIRFSKPHLARAIAEPWANALRREDFTVASIKKNTHMCSLHFIGNIVFTRNHV